MLHLENNRVAKFFIGTILDCEVLTLVPETQEYVFTDEMKDAVTLLLKELESEQYYSGAMDEMFGEKDRELASNKITMEQNQKELEQNKKEIEQNQKELEQNKTALINSAKELLKAGLSVDRISEITGLDIDEF